MNLFPSEEQRQLRHSVGRLLGERATSIDSTANPAAGDFDADAWKALADLGAMALTIPEAYGGMGRDLDDAAHLLEEAGEHLTALPLTTTLICSHLLATAGAERQRSDWLPGLASGSTRLALAYLEVGSTFGAGPLHVTARRADEGTWLLSGRKRLVLDFAVADHFLVTARVGGDSADSCAIFMLPADAAGLQAAHYATIDARHAADLLLEEVSIADDHRLSGADAAAALSAALDDAVIAGCFEATGLMRALVRQTVEYVKTRNQFGKPLAQNQALQHRLADMAVQLEEAVALSLRALLSRGDPPTYRAYAVSSAKLKVSRCARGVFEGAMQLHGAMGMTEELDVGARARRLLAIELSYGTPAEHQARLVSLRSQGIAPCASPLTEIPCN